MLGPPRPLHRQTKEAANRYVQPTATAPHLDLYEAPRVKRLVVINTFSSFVSRDSRECSSALMAWQSPLLGRAERSTPQSPEGRAGRREGLTAKARAEPQ